MSFQSENDFDLVKSQGAGHWPGIIGSMYPDLAPIMQRPGQLRCACPIHGSSKGAGGDGFRLFDDFVQTGGGICNSCGAFPTAIDLVMFLSGCDKFAAVEQLKQQMGLSSSGRSFRPRRFKVPVIDPKNARVDQLKAMDRKKLLARIWSEAKSLNELPDDHQAISYLRDVRGIGSVEFIRGQRHMRFHANLYYARSDIEGEPPVCFPGIVSMMHGADGKAVGLHRIFLDTDAPKKAPVDKPKKILRCLEQKLNGAVRIIGRAPATTHVNVCEGIETGLAISYSTGHPVFAAGYATLVKSWQAPASVRFVTIWADRDEGRAGINHALQLKERLTSEGLSCRILEPAYLNTASEDWNDVLLARGYKAICDGYSQISVHTLVQ